MKTQHPASGVGREGKTEPFKTSGDWRARLGTPKMRRCGSKLHRRSRDATYPGETAASNSTVLPFRIPVKAYRILRAASAGLFTSELFRKLSGCDYDSTHINSRSYLCYGLEKGVNCWI